MVQASSFLIMLAFATVMTQAIPLQRQRHSNDDNKSDGDVNDQSKIPYRFQEPPGDPSVSEGFGATQQNALMEGFAPGQQSTDTNTGAQTPASPNPATPPVTPPATGCSGAPAAPAKAPAGEAGTSTTGDPKTQAGAYGADAAIFNGAGGI